MTNIDFHTLRKQLIEGKNDSLRFIFEEYGSFCINNLVFKNKCTREDADDIFVDAVLNFREKVVTGKLTEMKSMKNYLYGTCMNMFKEKLKKEKKKEVHFNVVKEGYKNRELRIFEEDDINEKRLAACKHAMKKLGTKCQQILKLFYFMNLPMSDIAVEMNFASGDVAKTIKSRCYKKWLEEIKKYNV